MACTVVVCAKWPMHWGAKQAPALVAQPYLKGQLARQPARPKHGCQAGPLGLHLQPALQHSPHTAQHLIPLNHALLQQPQWSWR